MRGGHIDRRALSTDARQLAPGSWLAHAGLPQGGPQRSLRRSAAVLPAPPGRRSTLLPRSGRDGQPGEPGSKREAPGRDGHRLPTLGRGPAPPNGGTRPVSRGTTNRRSGRCKDRSGIRRTGVNGSLSARAAARVIQPAERCRCRRERLQHRVLFFVAVGLLGPGLPPDGGISSAQSAAPCDPSRKGNSKELPARWAHPAQ
jgi:hypothetical protein